MPDARPNGRARQATRRELTDAISETVHVVNNHGPAILELQARFDAQAIRIKKLEEQLACKGWQRLRWLVGC